MGQVSITAHNCDCSDQQRKNTMINASTPKNPTTLGTQVRVPYTLTYLQATPASRQKYMRARACVCACNCECARDCSVCARARVTIKSR